jgi:hypothetical protein
MGEQEQEDKDEDEEDAECHHLYRWTKRVRCPRRRRIF